MADFVKFLEKAKKRAAQGREPILGEVKYDYQEAVSDALGMPGRMLSGSKQGPKGETVYWNACVFNADGVQVWHGDLNLTRQIDELEALAAKVGPLYVTPEQPFRFEGLKAGMKGPKADRVVRFPPSDIRGGR